MRKTILITLVVTVLGFISYVYAEDKIEKMPSAALEWWLRSQDKFKDAKVFVKQSSDGSYEVVDWKVAGVSKPSNQEVNQIISNYQSQPTIEKLTVEERIVKLEKEVETLKKDQGSKNSSGN